jgi:hypothetical protein
MRGVRPVDPRNDCIDLYHSPTIYAPVCAALGLCGGFGKCKIFGEGVKPEQTGRELYMGAGDRERE